MNAERCSSGRNYMYHIRKMKIADSVKLICSCAEMKHCNTTIFNFIFFKAGFVFVSIVTPQWAFGAKMTS